ncbi:MAG: hypothetical protein K2Z81_12875, partial [Cyanobacteria bacterium]|nr:hypothetical protein [Cyanobacteriota bacterium]
QIVRKCGRAARLNLSAQVLRNTCIGNLLRKLDTVSVSQITGADLEVLRRFKDVSEKDVLQRVEQLHDRANETVTRLPGTAFAPSLSGSQVNVLSQVTQF